MRLVLLLIAGALLLAPAASGQEPARDVLPDLDQLAPGNLVVTKRTAAGRRTFRLGFDSAAANVGAGPLRLHGHRRSRRVRRMQVDQLVNRTEGPPRLIRKVGSMSYVVHPDHRHWHLLGFERYELRSGAGGPTLATDRKTGFCLGDRFELPDAFALPGFVPTPLQGDTCGLGQPDLTTLFAGISIGWGDRYVANLEGQFIDITRLSSGVYTLIHRANTDARLLESDYRNNASSARFRLRWRKNRDRLPRIRVLRRCPGAATCLK